MWAVFQRCPSIREWADEFIKPNTVNFGSTLEQALDISAEDMDRRIDQLCEQ